MKVGFIGCGNMGSALARSVMKSLPAWQVMISEKDEAKAASFSAETGAMVGDISEIASDCRYIFLAVKPQMLSELSFTLAPMLEKRESGFVIVSMAAGVTTDSIKNMFGDHPVIRIMPNLPVSVGEGMILYTPTEDVKEEELKSFLDMMKNAGRLMRLDESLIDAGTSVSGCGPAFACMVIDALSQGGENCGLSREDSLLLAEQTLIGTSKLLMESKGDPTALRDAVCSPGGSTIEGVRSLDKDGVTEIFCRAVDASYKRNVELGK